MNLPETSLTNLCNLGYTTDEARFLYVAATHSGYFSIRQFLQFTGTKSGDKSMVFSQKLLRKGHATARSFLRNGHLYHVFSRIVYRAIGRESLRNRRAHSLEHIRARLVALDFILGHLQYEYLETADDKLDYFCQRLDFPKALLPEILGYMRALQNHGVTVKVLTGDNDLVTRKVCREVGLNADDILLGSKVETMTDDEAVQPFAVVVTVTV